MTDNTEQPDLKRAVELLREQATRIARSERDRRRKQRQRGSRPVG